MEYKSVKKDESVGSRFFNEGIAFCCTSKMWSGYDGFGWWNAINVFASRNRFTGITKLICTKIQPIHGVSIQSNLRMTQSPITSYSIYPGSPKTLYSSSSEVIPASDSTGTFNTFSA